MFKTALLMAAASANELHLIELNEAPKQRTVVFDQVGGQDIFEMDEEVTQADPDPIKLGS